MAYPTPDPEHLMAELLGVGITHYPPLLGQPASYANLLRMVLGRQLVHGANPALRWMADNLVVSQDAAGNVKPEKAKSREKIDGMVAGVIQSMSI